MSSGRVGLQALLRARAVLRALFEEEDMTEIETVSSWQCHGGVQGVYRHASTATGTPMTFAVFVPPQHAAGFVPVLWFLSGLTCTHANVMEKAGYQALAAELGIMVVCPDTSPRGDGVADDAAYDLGQGAGFYLDATQAPWAAQFRMESYIRDELPALIAAKFPADMARQGITGHSMGGHGALVMALRNPGRFASVSAFAPIVAPASVPWGEKAFAAYLGPDRAAWQAYDACALIAAGARLPDLLVDQGAADSFLDGQLQPQRLAAACAAAGIALSLRLQPGYDHSYYFIQSFMADHLRWHGDRLGAG
jgi:S-formylglutathione hydrolase